MAGFRERGIGDQFSNNRSYALNERRQTIDYRFSQYTEINGVVVVNEPVAHCYDISPWNLCVLLLRLIGNAICRLANNLHQFYQGELHHFILFQIILTGSAQHIYRLGGVNAHVNKPYPVVTPVHTESLLNRLLPP